MRRMILLAGVLVCFAGCAGLSVSPGDSGKGVRYYQSSAYLLVYTDNSGGLKTELIYLPDRSRIMSAYPYGILANNSTTLEFQNGVLTGSESEPDATVIPKAVISALEKVATASIAAALRDPEEGKPHVVPAPRLFKIEFDADTKEAYLVGREGRVDPGKRTDVNVKGAPQVQQQNPPPANAPTEIPKPVPTPAPNPPSANPPQPPTGGAR